MERQRESGDQRPETRCHATGNDFSDGMAFELTSTAKLIDEPENQADDYADDEAGDKRKIKRAVFSAIADIAGETSESKREFWTEVEECADEDEHRSDGEEQAAEFLNWFHADSLALEGS